MRFARVTATLTPAAAVTGDGNPLVLRVVMDDGRAVSVVREGDVLPLPVPVGEPDPIAWQCDQYLQETIANELAEDGWEIVGLAAASDVPPRGAVIDGAAPTYVVRQR